MMGFTPPYGFGDESASLGGNSARVGPTSRRGERGEPVES
jgi:hypothetical protein